MCMAAAVVRAPDHWLPWLRMEQVQVKAKLSTDRYLQGKQWCQCWRWAELWYYKRKICRVSGSFFSQACWPEASRLRPNQFLHWDFFSKLASRDSVKIHIQTSGTISQHYMGIRDSNKKMLLPYDENLFLFPQICLPPNVLFQGGTTFLLSSSFLSFFFFFFFLYLFQQPVEIFSLSVNSPFSSLSLGQTLEETVLAGRMNRANVSLSEWKWKNMRWLMPSSG